MLLEGKIIFLFESPLHYVSMQFKEFNRRHDFYKTLWHIKELVDEAK